MLNSHKNFEHFELIIIKICKFFAESIQESDLTFDNNLKIDKDLFILKFCNDSNFIDIENFFRRCYPEILRFLVNSKNFNLMSTENIRKNLQKDLIDLDTNERIEILFYLINSAYDLNSVRQNIKMDSFKKNELIKERSILEFEYRTKENRRREIEKMEKFLTANNKIKLISDRIENLEKNPEEIMRICKETNPQKLKKELETEKERYISVNNYFNYVASKRI